MRSTTVIISSNLAELGRCGRRRGLLPDFASVGAQRPEQRLALDHPFGDHGPVAQDDRDAPVVEVVEAVVGVDVGQLRFEAKLSEEAESLVAQMTSPGG